MLVAAPGADPGMTENEWPKFLHIPNEWFYDFNKIRSEIVRDMEVKTGPTQAFCQLARINEGSR